MNQQDLKATLQQLRAEVDSLSFRDPHARGRIKKLIADIEQTLANAGDASQQESLIEGLKTTIDQFELEHPTFAALLNQLILALSSMGI